MSDSPARVTRRSVTRAAAATLVAIVAGCTTTPAEGPTAATPSATPPVGSYRTLVLDEGFDGDSLNRKTWTDQRGTPPHTYGSPYNPTKENTYFEPGQVAVRDGMLVLRAEPRSVTDPLGGAQYDFVSGVVHSGPTGGFRYGYVEARMLIPQEDGYWPAFWMLPTPVDGGWPPEIDIAEFSTVVGTTTRPSFNVHWRDASGAHRQAGPAHYGATGVDHRGTWHTYGLLWEPGRAQVFVDGAPGPVFEGDHIPAQPMYIVLGMGVVRGQTPAAAEMLVDHVRVWSDEPSPAPSS